MEQGRHLLFFKDLVILESEAKLSDKSPQRTQVSWWFDVQKSQRKFAISGWKIEKSFTPEQCVMCNILDWKSSYDSGFWTCIGMTFLTKDGHGIW